MDDNQNGFLHEDGIARCYAVSVFMYPGLTAFYAISVKKFPLAKTGW